MINKATIKMIIKKRMKGEVSNVGIFEGRPYDDEPVMMDAIDNMKNVLLSKGYDVTYEHFQSGHDYLSWGETLANGLIALLGNK